MGSGAGRAVSEQGEYLPTMAIQGNMGVMLRAAGAVVVRRPVHASRPVADTTECGGRQQLIAEEASAKFGPLMAPGFVTDSPSGSTVELDMQPGVATSAWWWPRWW